MSAAPARTTASGSAALRMLSSAATGIATGQMNAQEAFIKGRILLTGDQTALLAAQPVFGALDAVFRSVGERTQYA